MVRGCSSEIGIEFGKGVVSWCGVSLLLLGKFCGIESGRWFANDMS